MALFKNKYRIQSSRLAGWDYGRAGCYYVTVCTKNREPFFGNVVKGEVVLSPLGEIVADEWLRTETVRSNVKLDEWIVMPNHMHMILIITHKIEPNVETSRHMETLHQVETPRHTETPQRGVSTGVCTSAASEKWAANTLGAIMGQFKGKCTKRIKAKGYNHFAWQARFYDRIVRDEGALHKARRYIQLNPIHWDKDRDNVAGLYM